MHIISLLLEVSIHDKKKKMYVSRLDFSQFDKKDGLLLGMGQHFDQKTPHANNSHLFLFETISPVNV